MEGFPLPRFRLARQKPEIVLPIHLVARRGRKTNRFNRIGLPMNRKFPGAHAERRHNQQDDE